MKKRAVSYSGVMAALIVLGSLPPYGKSSLAAEALEITAEQTITAEGDASADTTGQDGETQVILPAIEVTEEQNFFGTETVNRDQIDIYGGASQLNPYSAISTLPGVDIRNEDGYGMSISHRIRGKSDRNIGETLQGLPLKGIGPGGGLSSMIDLENLESITVEKGAVNVDSGLGYGSDNGMVNMNIRQAKDEAGVLVKQSFGSSNFLRSFFRLDSGDMGDVAKAFVSTSYTDAEKWKGSGDSPDGRKNVAFGLSSSDSHAVQWNINGVYNKEKNYSYRSMTYEQSQHLSANYDYDYNESLTGIPSADAAWYGYNYTDFTTYSLLGDLSVPVSLLQDASVTFKPYFLRDEGNRMYTSGTSVIDWEVEHDTYGALAEYKGMLGNMELKAGYWYGEDEPPGPPTSRKTRTINSDGSLSFAGWERLIKVDENSTFNSPFVGSKYQLGRLNLNAGVRYLWWTTPSLTSMNVKGLGDVSYETALSQATKEDFSVEGDTYGIFLPKVGADYQLNDRVSLNAMYGRNYNTPQYGFGSQLTSYYKKGYSEQELQRMWNELIQPEESDNLDLGLKLVLGDFTWQGTLFYSLTQHTAGTYYDEEIEASCMQNAGESQSYGMEMQFGYRILDGLNANLSLTGNRYEFTEDFLAANGKTVINAEGNQIPETPFFLANLSLNWDIGKVSINPIVRYVGERYADVENTYKMDDFVLVDLDISWKIVESEKHDITLKLAASNLLDEEYIVTSSAGDQTTEISGLSFTAGAPRTIYASIQYEL